MNSNILSSRDVNAQVNPSPSPEKDMSKPKSMEYHRQMLASRLQEEQPTYVSPSDEIMSPATQKLKDFRGKHASKKSKPQTLFKKTSTRNFETAKNTPMFADMPKDVQEESSNANSDA